MLLLVCSSTFYSQLSVSNIYDMTTTGGILQVTFSVLLQSMYMAMYGQVQMVRNYIDLMEIYGSLQQLLPRKVLDI